MIDTLLPGKDFGLIITAALALLFFYILNTFMQYIVTYFGHMLGLNIETDMRRDLFSHLQKQPFGFYDNQKTGKLMSRMTTDLFEIGEVAHHGPEDIFISIMSLFGAFFLMLNINVKYQCEISDFDVYLSADFDCINCLLQQANDESNNRNF